MTSFDAFAQRVARDFGCRCTTVLLHHTEDAERIYSSDPFFVSPIGRKRFADAPAMAQLKAQRAPQRFEGEAQIRTMFVEADKLIRAGYLCLVNLPVVDEGGQLQGQVNLALPEGRLSDADLDALVHDAAALLPLLLAARATSSP